MEKIKVIQINKETKEEVECLYKRGDREAIEGDETYIYLFIEQGEVPIYDVEKEQLERVEERNFETMICKRYYKKVDIPKEVLIEGLNVSLGSHLDGYLLPTRIKHLHEGLELELLGDSVTSEQKERLVYLKSLKIWMDSERANRDEYEKDILNGGFPSFVWVPMPIKI